MEPPLIRVLLDDAILDEIENSIILLGTDYETAFTLLAGTIEYQYCAIVDAIEFLYMESDVLREHVGLIKSGHLNTREYEAYIDNFNEFDCSNPLFMYERYPQADEDDLVTALMDLSTECSFIANKIHDIVVDCKTDGTYDIDHNVEVQVILDNEYGVYVAYLS